MKMKVKFRVQNILVIHMCVYVFVNIYTHIPYTVIDVYVFIPV